MSRLPQPTVQDEYTSLVLGELDRDQSRRDAIASTASPFKSLSIGKDFEPTFDPQPSPGFFSSVGARISSGAADLDSLGASGYALMSIPEMIASTQLGDGVTVPGPYVDGNKNMLIDGSIRPSNEVRVEEFWEALPAQHRAFLGQSGIDLDFLNKQGYVTGEDFAEFYPRMVDSAIASQTIQSYAEEHSVLSGIGAGTAFVSNFVDPILILATALSAGTATPAVVSAQTGAKTTAKAGARVAVSRAVRGPTEALLRRYALTGERAVLTRSIAVGGGAITGAQYGMTGDLSAQINAMELGQLSGHEYKTHLSSAAIGLGLGAILGEFAYRGVNKSRVPDGNKIHLYNEAGTGSLSHMRHIARTNKVEGVPATSPPNIDDIADSDFVESILEDLYNDVAVGHVADYLVDANRLATVDMKEVGDLLRKFPSVEELEDALTRPDGFVGYKTKFSEMSQEVTRLIAQRDALLVVQKNPKAARKVQTKIDSLVSSLDTLVQENFRVDRPHLATVIQNRLTEEVPIETLTSQEARVGRTRDVLTKVAETSFPDYRGRKLTHHIQKKSKLIGSNLLLPRQAIKEDVASDDSIISMIGRLSGLIQSTGADGAEIVLDAQGRQIADASVRSKRLQRNELRHIRKAYTSALRSGASPREIFESVYGSRIHGLEVDPRFKEVYNTYFDGFVDPLGIRGINAGTIRSFREGFAPFHFSSDYDGKVARSAILKSYLTTYGEMYSKDDLSSPVNYRALKRANFLSREKDKGFQSLVNPATGEKYFDELPKTLGDLDADQLDAYIRVLDDSLQADAEDFFTRLVGAAKAETLDKAGLEGPVFRTNSIDPTKSRKADQRIYLDPEVLDSGIINMDISHISHGYARGTAYNIFRDEAVGELFGEKVTYSDLIKALTSMTSGNPERTAALNRLHGVDTRESGRFVVNKGGAVFASVANNLGATLISGTVGLAVTHTELAGSLIRTVGGRGAFVDKVHGLVDGIGRMKSTDLLTAAGIAHDSEIRSTRFISQWNDHVPDSVSRNLLVRGTKAGASLGRSLFLEKMLTRTSKSIHYSTSFMKLHTNRKKLDKLIAELPKVLPEGKELRGLARKFNIPEHDLKAMKLAGVLEPSTMRAAKSLLDTNPNALRTQKSIMETLTSPKFKGSRQDAMTLYDSLSDLAIKDADRFVATPVSTDLEISQSPILNLIFSMASFQASFYNNTLTRIGETPYWKQAGMYSFLVGAEVSLQITRDLLYGGESLETIKEKWSEDPVSQLAQAVARLPVQGPMSFVPSTIYGLSTGSPEKGIEDFTGSATLSMLGNSMRSIWQAGDAAVSGEDLSENEKRRLNKYLPGMNSWMLRLLDEGSGGFEEDSDK